MVDVIVEVVFFFRVSILLVFRVFRSCFDINIYFCIRFRLCGSNGLEVERRVVWVEIVIVESWEILVFVLIV